MKYLTLFIFLIQFGCAKETKSTSSTPPVPQSQSNRICSNSVECANYCLRTYTCMQSTSSDSCMQGYYGCLGRPLPSTYTKVISKVIPFYNLTIVSAPAPDWYQNGYADQQEYSYEESDRYVKICDNAGICGVFQKNIE